MCVLVFVHVCSAMNALYISFHIPIVKANISMLLYNPKSCTPEENDFSGMGSVSAGGGKFLDALDVQRNSNALFLFIENTNLM